MSDVTTAKKTWWQKMEEWPDCECNKIYQLNGPIASDRDICKIHGLQIVKAIAKFQMQATGKGKSWYKPQEVYLCSQCGDIALNEGGAKVI